MTFVESIQTCFRKYADFSGVASRSEFWWWVLFCAVTGLVLSMISETLGLVFNLAVLLPYIAVTTRRLHDTDRSGWWQLLFLIPLLGAIAVLILCALKEERPTRYLPSHPE
jgi:uncharacterized membrane protein YhaH (DUF805 family)